jgi:RNA polymerase-binding transcription factor DksA
MGARGSVPGSHRPRFAPADLGLATSFPSLPVPEWYTPHVCYPSPTMVQSKLTKKEVDDLRARLLEEQTELRTQLATIEEESFASTQSEMAGDVGLDDESADAGTATFEREKDLSIEQNVRDLLDKIERALKRDDDGTYGICTRCGKPIEKARIKALPYVDLCIKDAQAQSRR